MNIHCLYNIFVFLFIDILGGKRMEREKLQQFFNEFNALQEKYGIKVLSDYEEHIDYNWDEEPYVSGVESYLVLYNQNCTKKLATIDWENILIDADRMWIYESKL